MAASSATAADNNINPFSRARSNENKSDVKRDEDAYRKKYVSLKHKCESIQLVSQFCSINLV